MRALGIISGLMLLAACAPALEPPRAVDPSPVEPSAPSECDETNPLIVEWPATNRAELEAAAAHGPVVVSYAGCVLKVLARCRANGKYEDQSSQPASRKLDIGSEPELRSALPLGAPHTVKDLVSSGHRLTLAVSTNVTSELHAVPTILEGDCDGATHYVNAMARGTFSLTAEARTSSGISVGTEVLAASAGARSIVGISLRPLGQVGGKPVAAGFGLGLSAPLPVPDIRPIAITPGNGDDITVLELLQAALTADREETLPSIGKAQAWDRVAHFQSRYSGMAERRRDEWQKHAAAQRAREDQVVALCPQYRADRSKLDRLLHLDRSVLGAREKDIYQKEFTSAYAAWPELPACQKLEQEAALRAAWPALHGANDGMIRIHGGTFAMGSGIKEDEGMPVHSVTVADFEIDATEITVDQYSHCERAGSCSARHSEHGDDGWRCSTTRRRPEMFADAPANCMSFNQAAAYCHWAHKRLPTEEEWEYAARGPDSRRYPWGEWAKNDNNYPVFPFTYCAIPGADNGYQVGTLATNASPFGVRDMAGSVWEWTNGSFNAKERPLRGGEFGWVGNDASCMPYPAAYRFHHDPASADSNLGARCAR
jgi:formylglycine-generating enzyme required for sulfatase activity